MRLTLRNMLAYLDGILDAEDAHDLAKKIQESKFASDLMHRIRDLMRRMRLPAPSISDKGPGLDPNTVAEYLDNTLPADRVTDFEKVCLESNTAMADIHLAEVAACHQVLTLVLGEPADIDPKTRERIYQLPNRAKPPEPTPPAHSTHAPPPLPAHPPETSAAPQEFLDLRSRPKPKVPDYLRDPKKKWSWFPVTAGILGAVLFILIVLTFTNQFEKGSALRNLFGGSEKEVVIDQGDKKNTEPDSTSKTDDSTPDNQGTAAPQTPDTTTTPENNPDPNKNPTVNPAAPTTGTESPLPPTEDNGQGTSAPNENAPPSGDLPMPDANGDNPPPPVKDETTTNQPPEKTETPTKEPPATTVATDTPPAEPKPMGRFTSTDQILLHTTGEQGIWSRAQEKAIVFPQEHLLALPTYRPSITLSSGLILQLLGGTEVTLLPDEPQKPAGIKIRYGRVVINSVANPGLQLRVVIGDQTHTLTFVNADSMVGIQVGRVHALGTNPEDESARIMTELFITKDKVSWSDGAQSPLEMTAPAHLLLLPGVPATPDRPKDMPNWIAGQEPTSDIDQRTSARMFQAFTPEVPAQQKLLELADAATRMIELRRLSIRSLGYIGDFDAMVKTLNDPECKSDWNDRYFVWLCDAVKRDPQAAAAVREALDKNFGAQSADMYRMLWGYTNDNLIAGDDEKLVRALEDETLALRVLGICNLKNITERDIGFKPTDTPQQRKRIVAIWEQRLKSKTEIRSKQTEK
jgi:hypothetical protein